MSCFKATDINNSWKETPIKVQANPVNVVLLVGRTPYKDQGVPYAYLQQASACDCGHHIVLRDPHSRAQGKMWDHVTAISPQPTLLES